MNTIPDPSHIHPTTRTDLTNGVFLQPPVPSSLIEVGEYTYQDNDDLATLLDQVQDHYEPKQARGGQEFSVVSICWNAAESSSSAGNAFFSSVGKDS